MNESDYKTRLVAQVRKIGGYGRRFEDRYGVGVLDVIAIFDNLPAAFVEGKIIRHNTFGPTEIQYVEGLRVLKLTGGYATAVLVGWDDNGIMYVGEWARSLPVRACMTQNKGDDYAATLWRFIRDQAKRTSGQHTGGS